MAEFVHLHCHTEFSMLDGLCRVPELIKTAKGYGMPALALTDHGGMYGAIQFYTEAKKAGINPILGVETYVAPGSHTSKTTADKNPYHLVLLAKDLTGYRNLMALVTTSYVDGFYYKPRVDHDLLAKHRDGLICLSACPSGEVLRPLAKGDRDSAIAAIKTYREIFGEDYFLEVQDHDMAEFAQAHRDLVDIGTSMGIPIVATNDLHYIHQHHHHAQDVLLCIQTNALLSETNRMRMEGDSFYLKTADEMDRMFDGLPEALRNTLVIAERCDLKLDFDRVQLPEVPRPDGMTADDYLRHLCYERLPKRYGGTLPANVEERLRMELEVIEKTQFANYFLVVEDIATETRRRGILFGVRGSAAGSIVLYALGITDIDPVEKVLVFERFLNIERKEMPDIDLDFQDDRRGELIDYVTQKYGRDHVAQIITFGTLGAKAAVRDVGKALGMPYSLCDRVAKLIPQQLKITIDGAVEQNPELRQLMKDDPAVNTLIETAKQLEGVTRHASTHAAGVVISKEPLIQAAPLQRPSKGDEAGILMTQFDMDSVAKINLLKMDFLGLINLQVIAKCRDLIREHEPDFDLARIPTDDAATFELLSSGETGNVFQLESPPMRKYIKELKPTTIAEVAAMIALYRPGPMAHIPRFIDSKFGRVNISYPHDSLKEILDETYGVIVYQDQVLFIVQLVAGFSLGKADIFRKAMGKKIAEVMKGQRADFMTGALENGYTEGEASAIFDLIEPFAGYAFNKAHSACYAELAYQTAYLKANYSAEYLAAVLSSNLDVSEKIALTIADAKRMGFQVVRPDVNRSGVEFTIEGEGTIRFGLGAVRNVGHGAAEAIVAARAEGVFTSIDDFCRRVDSKAVNRRVIESLTKAGALDDLGDRGGLIGAIDRIIASAQRQAKLRDSGQTTMFDLFGAEVPVPQPSIEIQAASVSSKERLAWEKDVLGVYLSEHPFSPAAADKNLHAEFCGEITEDRIGQTVLVAGMVASVRTIFTKDGRAFCSAMIEDLVGSCEVTVWSDVYDRTRDLWVEGQIVKVRGRVKPRQDSVQIVADDVMAYTPGETTEADLTAPARVGRRVVVTFRETGTPATDIARLDDLISILTRHAGDDPLVLVVTNGKAKLRADLPAIRGVAYSDDLRTRLDGLLGLGATALEQFEIGPAEDDENKKGKKERGGWAAGA